MWQPIQAVYRVSILTFISCAEKGKSLGPIPYFSAVIDFLFVQDLLASVDLFLPDSFELLYSTFSACSSTTSRKHGSQYATELPAFQPLTVSSFSKTEQGIQKYSWHRIFCTLKARGARLFFFTRHFSLNFSQFSDPCMATA